MVVFLRSFISALFLSFFSGPSLTEMKFTETFSLVYVIKSVKYPLPADVTLTLLQ